MTAVEAAAQSPVFAAFRLEDGGRWWVYSQPRHLLFRSVEDSVSEAESFTDWQPGYPPERKSRQKTA
jgi:hypothetical protein